MSDLKKKLDEWKGAIRKEFFRQLDAQTRRNSYATISNEVLDGVRYNWYKEGIKSGLILSGMLFPQYRTLSLAVFLANYIYKTISIANIQGVEAARDSLIREMFYGQPQPKDPGKKGDVN
jgi:hypothetical protein